MLTWWFFFSLSKILWKPCIKRIKSMIELLRLRFWSKLVSGHTNGFNNECNYFISPNFFALLFFQRHWLLPVSTVTTGAFRHLTPIVVLHTQDWAAKGEHQSQAKPSQANPSQSSLELASKWRPSSPITGKLGNFTFFCTGPQSQLEHPNDHWDQLKTLSHLLESPTNSPELPPWFEPGECR